MDPTLKEIPECHFRKFSVLCEKKKGNGKAPFCEI
jgi:hypothetical protein